MLTMDDDIIDNDYDLKMKALFSNTNILAEIAKQFVHGYEDMPIEEVRKYVNPNRTTTTTMINTESNTPYVRKTVFDTMFEVDVPDNNTIVKVRLGVEGESSTRRGYPIVNRQQYYVANMLVSQKGEVFENQDYGNLRRCVSVWIMANPRKRDMNTVFSYHMVPEAIDGDVSKAERMDLMTIVIANLGNPNDSEVCRAMRMLNLLFSDGVEESKRKDKLLNDFDVDVDMVLLRKVRDSMGVLSKEELELEYKAGVRDGRRDERIDLKTEDVIAIMKSFGISMEEAMEILSVDQSIRDKVRVEVLRRKNSESLKS